MSKLNKEIDSIRTNKSKKLLMTIQNVARRKLRIIEAAKVVEDLRIPRRNS
ncbi:plasmid maintenance system killer family protein [Treponema medium]|uniref:Plasmid maintenance system killer family protein n=1 Tax=Treponema medium TaxID=58231 RepID=A0ABX7LXE5_TREMD|nr:plasmid maintenance system killer family protein [Treponema medium]QSH97655.1 plasmid maintenance system killer family protein [Treponema medium]